jgi:hypothetical protein
VRAMKVDLKDTVLCAVDSANVALTARALHLSMEHCDFAESVLFTDAPVSGAFRTVKIDKLNSHADYQMFCLARLSEIAAPYVLVVEWDGYVVHPKAWNPKFCEYDYIGARWPGYPADRSVGNSGFCLRSRRLQKALTDPRFKADGTENVDVLICRKFRPALERDFGIRFAPEDVADMFSYELTVPKKPTFGFHGLRNMWRYVDDKEMLKLADLFAPYVFRTPHFAHMLISYFIFSKFDPLVALYAKMNKHVRTDEIQRLMAISTHDPAVANNCIALCEDLLR